MTTMSNDNRLAVLGGHPVIASALPPYPSMGEDDVAAAAGVIRSGVLSGYIGAPGAAFMGGERVQAFEAQCAEYFGVRHALAVNSWTSGLICAVGALGLEPGDEVITTPWTMAATATAVLQWNAIPVFADIDARTYNIDPASVERLITSKTKAIAAVDIFGLPADWNALRAIADRHGLKLIGDTAQAPGATYQGKPAGTQADIGGYSLNYHKHIHCGEGGILVTEDDRLARRLALIRNHAECVVDSDQPAELANMLGYNFRLGEIEAAIGAVQLTKLRERVAQRQRAAAQLDAGLRDLEGLTLPHVPDGSSHVYYIYGLQLDLRTLGVSRTALVDALRAEGVPGLIGSYQNIHCLPLYRHQVGYGTQGFPWNSPYARQGIAYGPGTCPVAERLHNENFIGIGIGQFLHDEPQVAMVIEAFRKVWAGREQLLRKAA